MPRYDATKAEVLVFTFKEGVLSAVAHDLKLRVGRGSIEVEGGVVRAELDAASLQVVTPMKDGLENPGALPTMLYREIEKNAHGDVLDVKRHPKITFVSTALTADSVTGTLTLHGASRAITGKRAGASAEFQLDQRDFGIKPFSAMLGTLKVKPALTVKVTLPADAFNGA